MIVFETYVLSIEVVDKENMLMTSRYDNEEYLQNVHMKSDAFVKMGESVFRLPSQPCSC